VIPHFAKGLAGLSLVLLVAVAVFALQNLALLNLAWYDYVFGGFLGAGLVVASYLAQKPLGNTSHPVFLSAVFIFYLATRLIWILTVPTLPVSDYASYNRLGIILSQGNPIYDDVWELSRNLSVQPWGYPLLLGLFYAVFGPSLLVAKLLNVLAGLGSLWFLYRLAANLCGVAVGRLAALFFAAWPAQVMYSSVLASEHLGMTFCLIGFLFVLRGLYRDNNSRRDFVIGGALLAVASIVRSAVVVALPAVLMAWLLARIPIKTNLIKAVILVSSFLFVYGTYLAGMSLVYRVTPLPRAGVNLLFGTNFESGGTWNEADSVSFVSHQSVQEADRFARAEAVRRILSSPGRFVVLMLKKVPITWADDTYGAVWSQGGLPTESFAAQHSFHMRALAGSQFFHILILVLAAMGCYQLLGQEPHKGMQLLFLFLLLGTLQHSILETQARYHFVMQPVVLILAAIGAAGFLQKFTMTVSNGELNEGRHEGPSESTLPSS
jgi:4-amino-4-deoxy-L-arabinose transferase-like glycosyltransferase